MSRKTTSYTKEKKVNEHTGVLAEVDAVLDLVLVVKEAGDNVELTEEILFFVLEALSHEAHQ